MRTHSNGHRRTIRVLRNETSRLDCGEARVTHGNRACNELIEERRKWRMRCASKNLAQHVRRNRVPPRGSRFAKQPPRCNSCQILLDGQSGLIHSVGDVRSVIGPGTGLE
jgi:hypothetical protein